MEEHFFHGYNLCVKVVCVVVAGRDRLAQNRDILEKPEVGSLKPEV